MGLGGGGGSECDREETQKRLSNCKKVSQGPGFRATVFLSPTTGCKGTSTSKSLQLKDTPLEVVLFAFGGILLVSEVTGQPALPSSFERLWAGCSGE